MKRSFAHACVGLALAVCLSTLAAALATAQQGSDASDPIDLFAKMMPVFSHDRCTGCHGRVNPELETGHNHSMGQFTDTRDCIDCHTQSPGWRTKPDLAFFNKDTKQLCLMQSGFVESIRGAARMQSVSVAQADAQYLDHLSMDSLIGAAYIGTRGGATDQAEPPGMNRKDFVTAAKAWLEVGSGCGKWKGEITQSETFGSNYEYPMPGLNGTVQVNETAGREIKITRDNGVTTGTFTMSGHQTIVQSMNLDGCSSVITSVGDWVSTTPANADAGMTIAIANDGSYTIRFVGPVETSRSSGSGHMVNDCGIAPFSDPAEPPTELTWGSWAFTIRCPSSHAICQIFDPDNQRLSGTMERVIKDHSDAADPQSRLTVSLAGISRADDGASLPVTVKTTWDLTLSE